MTAQQQDLADYDRAMVTPPAARTPSQNLLIAKMEKTAGMGTPSATATGRENVFTTRVMNALEGVRASFISLRGQPSVAGTGPLGVASGDASTLYGATTNWLKNSVNPDVATNYNTAWAGMSRQMANAEASGLVPSGTFASAFNALQFSTSDSPSERLHKLAQVTVDMDAVAASKLADPRVSPEQQEAIRQVQQEVRQLAPFTMDEVNALGNRAVRMSPDMTIEQWVQANRMKMDQLGIKPRSAQPQRLGAPTTRLGTPAAPLNVRPAAPAARPAAPSQGPTVSNW